MAITFDPESTKTTLIRFLSASLNHSGLDGYVIGLSGGIDSALAAALAVQAVGSERVLGLLMPYRSSSEDAIEDAQVVADFLKIEQKQIDITPMIDAYYDQIDDSMRLRAGNKMARERMSILFDHAHRMNRLVLGTGNRTEICLGYTTLFGDSACSVNPIGQLYKTEVRALARHLALPGQVITKPPSADLWKGQTDEGEIGVTYERIDRLLDLMIDQGVNSRQKLTADSLTDKELDRVLWLINQNAFKRQLPPVASLGRAEIPASITLET